MEKILVLSSDPDVKFNSHALIRPKDIGMDGIAAGIRGTSPIPCSVSNFIIGDDNSITFNKQNIENHFRQRYEMVKDRVRKMTIEDFCELNSSTSQLIEDRTGLYVLIINGNDSNNYMQPFDRFLRDIYRYCNTCQEDTYYIISCLAYY